jgi:hypothetical protein
VCTRDDVARRIKIGVAHVFVHAFGSISVSQPRYIHKVQTTDNL